MKKVWKLAIAFLREHPARVILTSFATIAATCTVIWIAAGYDSLLKTFDIWANKALGTYELSIAPIESKQEQTVPQAVLDAMRSDPAVVVAMPMWMVRTTVRSKAVDASEDEQALISGPAGIPPGLRAQYTLLASDSPRSPFDVDGRWLDGSATPVSEAVISKQAAERLRAGIGDEVAVVHDGRPHTLNVVGVLDTPPLGAGAFAVPRILTPAAGDVFVSTATAERILGERARISFIGIAMQPEADITQFRFGWAPKLSRFETPVQFQEAYEIEEALDESAAADNVQMQSYAATGVAMLVALLVIFCTISMGVTQRVRQFAILRAVVLTRSQLSLVIFTEGLILAAIGYCGGVALSWGLLQLVAGMSRHLLHHGAVVGTNSLILAAVATFGGAMLAAAIPAYRATRVRPVDAMAPSPQRAASRLPIGTIVVGLLLIGVNPVLTFVLPPASEGQVFVFLAIGFSAMAIGFVLISPAVVAVVDRVVGPLLAKALRIDPKLVASQITSHVWRTAAAAISMSVGLGLYIAVQVWGYTMLDAFIVGPWAPDAVISFQAGPLPLNKVDEIAAIPGIDRQACLPIVVEQPRLLDDITGSAERATVTRQDNVVIVGIDARAAFGGADPLFDVEWVAGSPQQAIGQMADGRGCIVPDHFLAESGLHLGDTLELVPPEASLRPVKYTIAGAVRLPGWHWQTKLTGFRSRTHRAAALVFAEYEPVARDFGFDGATHLWLNFSRPGIDSKSIEHSAKAIYAQSLSDQAASGAAADEAKLRLMPVEDIRQMTRNNARRWIWAISQLPLIAALIAAVGVLNVILASIRSRRWEIGVLRSIGVTQSAIMRAILVEGLMIGAVAALLSVGFGVLAGWCGCGMAQYFSFFGGLNPSLHVPPMAVGRGVVAALVLAVAASVWPAVSLGRMRPLTLLQQGRISF